MVINSIFVGNMLATNSKILLCHLLDFLNIYLKTLLCHLLDFLNIDLKILLYHLLDF